MGNPNHDEKTGQFSSGSSGAAAVGDHQAVSPSAMTRNVPGHGNLPRSKVVAMHEHHASVGTSSGGGGGGSGGTSSGGGQGGQLSAAARDRIIRNKATDQRHFPIRSDANIAAVTDQSKPMASITATPGRFNARSMKLKNGG